MKIEFTPQDLWIGLYWKTVFLLEDIENPKVTMKQTTFYLCIIPCFPIIWTRTKKI